MVGFRLFLYHFERIANPKGELCFTGNSTTNILWSTFILVCKPENLNVLLSIWLLFGQIMFYFLIV